MARAIRAAMLSELAEKHWHLLSNNIFSGDHASYNVPQQVKNHACPAAWRRHNSDLALLALTWFLTIVFSAVANLRAIKFKPVDMSLSAQSGSIPSKNSASRNLCPRLLSDIELMPYEKESSLRKR